MWGNPTLLYRDSLTLIAEINISRRNIVRKLG